QQRATNKYGVFLNHEGESVTYYYERNLNDPRIAHNLNLEVDNFGHVRQSAMVVYGRKSTETPAPENIAGLLTDEQARIHIVYSKNNFTNYFDEAGVFRAAMPSETETYELTGFAFSGGTGQYTND